MVSRLLGVGLWQISAKCCQYRYCHLETHRPSLVAVKAPHAFCSVAGEHHQCYLYGYLVVGFDGIVALKRTDSKMAGFMLSLGLCCSYLCLGRIRSDAQSYSVKSDWDKRKKEEKRQKTGGAKIECYY